jgi:predicted ATPase/DNA-binding winged helix-turn-helix (wHTH) protein
MGMAGSAGTPGKAVIGFGPFRLTAGERLLERDGRPVPLGGRALDVLIVLASKANKVVGKKELMEQVWPDVFVDEANLRTQMAALRKALGDGEEGARYIVTLPARGYCFVAPVSRTGAPQAADAAGPSPAHNLPTRLVRMVGRDEAVRAVAAQVAGGRFVTIVGPGGIGKTTLAVAAGHALLEEFGGVVRFVDLGQVGDPALVAAAAAAALGLVVQAADPAAGIAAFLRDTRVLLVLDGCEHVIDAAAALAESVHAEAPLVGILATSREALRIGGERVHRLAPLGSPPDQPGLTAAEALAFPAVQLFVERVAAGGGAFELGDADVPVVAGMCRDLDGVALAIELAAGRVGAYGVRETARLLEGRFRLLWPGRRTALPRHRTLAATLDWSHALLSEAERLVLRRLSIFVGAFDLEAARVAAASDGMGGERVEDAVVGLVAKSLVAVDSTGPATRYRLLDTTRVYALGKLADSGEAGQVAKLHAGYVRDLLVRVNTGASELSRAQASAVYGDHVGNVRAALEWSFGEGGDAEIGTALAAAAAPLFRGLSLLTECRRWTERAVAALGEASRGTRREIELQASLGQSLMFTMGNSEQVRAAFERGLAVAEETGCLEHQVQLLGWLHVLHERSCDHRASSAYAQRSEAAAVRLGDPAAVAAARSFLGVSYHMLGRHEDAEAHLTAALAPQAGRRGAQINFGFDHRTYPRISLARTLWLRGRAELAVQAASRTVEEAAGHGQPVPLCVALLYAVSISLWVGDWEGAEVGIDAVIEHAERHSLAPYRAAGTGLRGELDVRRGRAAAGVEALRDSLEALHGHRYEMLTAAFASAIAEGLALTGRLDDALATIDGALRRAERGGELLAMPEMLRIRAGIIACMPAAGPRDAEAVLVRSLHLARSQGAPAWELRTATSLAHLWARQGRDREAHRLLASVYDSFTEGFGTADLRAAKRVIEDLGRPAMAG